MALGWNAVAVAAYLCRANLRPGAMLPLGVVLTVLVVKLDRLPDLNQLPFVILGNVKSKMPCPQRNTWALPFSFVACHPGVFAVSVSDRQHNAGNLLLSC